MLSRTRSYGMVQFSVATAFQEPSRLPRRCWTTTPDPTEEEVRLAMDSNYCRCSGYEQQVEAVLDAAAQLRKGDTK